MLLLLLGRRFAGPYDDVALTLQHQLHGFPDPAEHRVERLRAVQRSLQPGGPADDRVRVDVHRVLGRDRDGQGVALADQPQPALSCPEKALLNRPTPAMPDPFTVAIRYDNEASKHSMARPPAHAAPGRSPAARQRRRSWRAVSTMRMVIVIA